MTRLTDEQIKRWSTLMEEAERRLGGLTDTERLLLQALSAERAERERAEAERDRLRETLREVLDWFAPESWGEAYEQWATEFTRETGRWCPGKSAPLEMHTDPVADHRDWKAWNEKRRGAIVSRARAALAGKEVDRG